MQIRSTHLLRRPLAQLYYRAFPHGLEERWGAGVATNGGWPATFQPSIATAAPDAPEKTDNGRGLFALGNERHDVFADSWAANGQSRAFRHHLHGFEWSWPLATNRSVWDRQDFEALWASWRRDIPTGRLDAWAPTVVAKRSWTLCGVFEDLVRDGRIEEDVLRTLRAGLGYLERNYNSTVSGVAAVTHLKATVGLAVFFSEDERLRQVLRSLEAYLADGFSRQGLKSSHDRRLLTQVADIESLLVEAGRVVPDWLSAAGGD